MKNPQDGALSQKKPRDLSKILYFKCNKMGRFANHCTNPPTDLIYYNCNKHGHMKNECPFPKKGSQGHAFATEKIPSTSSGQMGKHMSQGTLFIHDLPIKILFDASAFHGFISIDFVGRLKLKPILLNNPLCMSNPNGGPTNLDTMCLLVPISFRNYFFPFELFVLRFLGFGVLLGTN